MKKGHVIFLNGTSSAGKSTLSWEIQRQAEEKYYWISNDAFSDMPHNSYYERDWDGTFREAIEMMYKTVRLYVENGHNVIIDHVMLNENENQDRISCVETLKDVQVLFVFVKCPLEELNRREIARGDRNIGNAAGQYDKLYPESMYDVVVDTYSNSIEDCAMRILHENAIVPTEDGATTAFMRFAH